MVTTPTHINPPIHNKQDIVNNVHVHVAMQFYTYVATFLGDMDSPFFFFGEGNVSSFDGTSGGADSRSCIKIKYNNDCKLVVPITHCQLLLL